MPASTEIRFFVLTGGPSTGKTTLLNALRGRGHAVVEEVAREVILEDITGQLRSRPLEFQKEILRRQLEREERALKRGSSTGLIFLDRGVGDHFGYLRYRGIPVFPELESAWEAVRSLYEKVFLLERRPEYDSKGRSETEGEAARIHSALGEEYRVRHPRVIDLPWEPLERRVSSILKASLGE